MARPSKREATPPPPSPGRRPSATQSTPAVALGLLALVAAAYANTLRAPLLLDSRFIIGGDPRLRELTWHSLGLILSKGYWWPTYAIPLYRPLTTLTYLINWALLGNGEAPLGYHLVNLGLHAANTLLLFDLGRRWLGVTPGSRWVPAFAAALFAVHPIQTEAVTYLVGRADELVALGLLGGLWCHRQAAETAGGSRRRWLAALAGLALVAAFGKESGLLLIPALALHDALFAWPTLVGTGRERFGALLRTRGWGYLASLPAALALVIAREAVVGRDPNFLGWPFVDNPLVHASFAVRALTAAKVFALQVGLLVFPRTLSADYSYDAIPRFGSGPAADDALCWVGLAVLVAMLALALGLRRRAPGASWGLLFFLVLLLPTSNLLFPTGSIMAERFLYVPSIGFFLALASGLAWIGGRVAPRLAGVAAGALIAALGIRTHIRNAEWSDDLTLWRSTAAAEPRSVRARAGLARALLARGPDEANLDAAIASAQEGVDLLDGHPLAAEDRDDGLYTELAHLLRTKAELERARNDDAAADGLLQRAWTLLQRAQEIDGDVARRIAAARQAAGGPGGAVGNHAIYLEVFSTAADLQRWPEAAAAAERARALGPLDPAAHLDLARVRLSEGRLDEAALATMESLIVDASDAEAWTQLGTLYSALGEDGAIRHSGDRPSFNASVPQVRRHLNRACGELVSLLVAAGSLESARVLYHRATDPADLGVPADAIAAPP